MRMITVAFACFALVLLAGCPRAAKEKGPGKPASGAAKGPGAGAAVDAPAPSPKAGTPESPAAGKQPAAPAGLEQPAPAPAAPEKPAAETAVQPNVTKLEITDLVVGTGAVAESGKSVTVHYRGTLTNGKEFDASRRHGRPFTFDLGARKVIRGWDEGVKGMKVGGKRKLVIPPDMGYGEDGAGDDIPPNATLVFEVELLDVK